MRQWNYDYGHGLWFHHVSFPCPIFIHLVEDSHGYRSLPYRLPCYCFKALVVEEFYRMCLDKAPRDMPVWIPTMTVTGHSWIEVGLNS